MAYRTKTYTLREETDEGGARYFISFKDGQGKYHELEVSHAFYMEFRRLELDNRKIQNWNWRHREFNEVWEETLQRRALRLSKSVLVKHFGNALFEKYLPVPCLHRCQIIVV